MKGTKQDTSKRLKSANYSEAERENNSDDDSDSSCEVMLNGTKKDTSRRLRSANYERENDSDDNSNSSCDEMLNAPRILRPKKLISPDVSLISNTDYGRLVWAKMSGFRFWPSVIINCHDCGMEAPSQQSAWVFWFSDNRVSQIPLSKIMDFAKNFASLHMKIYMSPSNSATLECLKEYRHQSKLVPLESQESLMAWANSAFPGAVNFEHNTDLDLSSKVKRCLSRIKKMKLRELTLKDLSSSTSSDESSLEERQNRKKKVSLMQAVREGTHDIETLCIACNRMDCEVVSPHPYFLGGICQSCKEELEDNVMTIGDDGDPKYCAVCGGPGEVLLCDEPQCERVFCTGCIELLVSPDAVQTIMDIDPWYCFLCEPYHPDTHGLIRPRPDWKNKLPSKSRGQKTSNVEDDTPDASTFPRRPLRVLSLFDGIGTGLLVLDRLGLEVEKYYASEVEEAAMNVSHLNFGPRITRVGNVQTLSSKKIAELYPIDLLIGGSPCNDLSAVNPKRKGLYDPTGTGILFFHYYRILKILQAEARAKAIHLFWLFENVSSMPREFMTEISLFFEREPCVIDAKHFSPQRRARYFWGNLPGMYDPIPSHLQENYRLSQYLHKIGDREALVQKVNCITTNTASLRLNLGKVWPIRMNEKGDVPWVTEIEKIFGFPLHFTDVGNLSSRERLALLGKSWSVPVIAYILKPLTNYFPRKNNCLATDVVQREGRQDISWVRPALEESEIGTTAESSEIETTAENFEIETTVDNSEIETTAENSEIEITAENSETETTAENSETETTAENSKTEVTAENSEIETTAENSEIETTAENSEIETIAENSEIETTAENSEIETTAENSEIEITAENSETETTAENSETETTAENSKIEVTAENSEIETTAENSEIETTAENSEIETIAENSEIETTAENSEIETTVENSEIETTAENFEIETTVENSEIETTAENSEIEITAENSEIETTAENSETETSAENSETETTAENSKTEITAENSEIETTAENSEIETIAENSEIETTAENSEIETTAENSEIETTVQNSEIETTVENSEIETTAKNSEIETTAENSEIETTIENSETETTAENSETETTAENLETEATAENSKIEITAENSEIETTAENSEIETTAENSEIETTAGEVSEIKCSTKNMRVNAYSHPKTTYIPLVEQFAGSHIGNDLQSGNINKCENVLKDLNVRKAVKIRVITFGENVPLIKDHKNINNSTQRYKYVQDSLLKNSTLKDKLIEYVNNNKSISELEEVLRKMKKLTVNLSRCIVKESQGKSINKPNKTEALRKMKKLTVNLSRCIVEESQGKSINKPNKTEALRKLKKLTVNLSRCIVEESQWQSINKPNKTETKQLTKVSKLHSKDFVSKSLQQNSNKRIKSCHNLTDTVDTLNYTLRSKEKENKRRLRSQTEEEKCNTHENLPPKKRKKNNQDYKKKMRNQ
nr:uncharacterized protein LOC128700877 isoform X2 [Cherax quadricarinatus]